MRPGSPQGRNLSLSSSSFSFTFPFSPGWVKRKVQRIMAVLSLCKKGMGTPVKCLAFCDNEEKSKSLFHSGICTGTVHDHLKRMVTAGGSSLFNTMTPKILWRCTQLNNTCNNNLTCHIHQYTMKLLNKVTWSTLWKKKCDCRWCCTVGSSRLSTIIIYAPATQPLILEFIQAEGRIIGKSVKYQRSFASVKKVVQTLD